MMDNTNVGKKKYSWMIRLVIFGIIIILIGTILSITGIDAKPKPCSWLDNTVLSHSGCLKKIDQALSIGNVLFMPNSDRLVTSSLQGQVQIWQIADIKEVLSLDEHEKMFTKMAISPDGTVLAVTSGYQVKLWRVADGVLLQTIGEFRDIVTDVAFSPDGKTLAVAVRDYVSGKPNIPLHTVQLLDMGDKTLLNALQGPTSHVQSIAFAPNGELLASGGDDGIWLWNVQDGKLLSTLEEHDGVVESVAFSPDSTILASGSRDKTIRLWRTTDGIPLNVLKGHTYAVLSVTFSPDGTLLASGSKDATARLWRVADGELLNTSTHGWWFLRNWVWDVAISPDGAVMATATGLAPVRLFDVQQMLKQ